MIHRRALLGGLAAPLLLGAGGAEAFPTRTIRLVVPFAAGGATDVIARGLAERMGIGWGVSPVIENKPGAGSNLGIDQVARAEADCGTLLIASIGLAVNQFLFGRISYDPVADLAPVSLICLMPNIMVVPKDSPATDVAGFVAMAKARGGALTYASSGTGTSLHLSGELFKRLAGVEMTHVPYRGSAPALQDLIAGRVDVMFDNATSALPQVQGGTVRGLGVTTAARIPAAPELPSIGDAVKGFDVSSWFGLFAPGKTPPDIVARISADAQAALRAPDLRSRLEALGAVVVGSTPEALKAHVRSEIDRWGPVIREANIKAE